MKQDIAQIIQRLYDIDVDVVLTRPDVKFGDYATNVALQLAKPLARNPREIADQACLRRPGRARDGQHDQRADAAHQEAHEQRHDEGVLLHLALDHPVHGGEQRDAERGPEGDGERHGLTRSGLRK